VPVIEAAAVAGRVARARRLGLTWPNGTGLASNSQLGSALRWSVATMGRSYAHATTTPRDRLSRSQRAFSGTQAQFRYWADSSSKQSEGVDIWKSSPR
jgi:hypothetical protein